MADPPSVSQRPGSVSQNPGVQVIGLCRFSYLGFGGFKVMFDRSLEDRRAMLYGRDRLEARMIWFEQVFLPGLRDQTDPDFTMVVLTGEDLPQPWLDRLRALVAPIRQFRLMLLPPTDHRRACAAVVTAAVDPGGGATAQFRLDDDDAVAIDYVERIRSDFALMPGLYTEGRGMAVDYTRGIVLEDAGGTIRADIRAETFWGCGLTLYLPAGSSRQILNYQHHLVWQHLPTVVRGGKLMWVRGAHQSNDSRFRRPNPMAAPNRELITAALADRFRIDLKGLEDRLAACHTGT